MVARIFKKSKTSMQSGSGNANHWILEMNQTDTRPIEEVMSWVGSSDTNSQVRLKFKTRDEATKFARKNNISFFLDEVFKKKLNIRKNGYGDNFAFNRKTPWTH